MGRDIYMYVEREREICISIKLLPYKHHHGAEEERVPSEGSGNVHGPDRVGEMENGASNFRFPH